jgi:hypothetical protein
MDNIFTCLNDKLYEDDISYLLSTLLPDNKFDRAVGVKVPFFKPGDTVTIRVETNNTSMLAQVQKILQQYAFPFINLKFMFVGADVDKPNFRIILGASSDFSGGVTIGIGTEFSITNIYAFNQGSILHEFGHALGRFHEHQNPDPSNPLNFIADKVYAYYKDKMGWDKTIVDSQILQRFPFDLVSTLPFDNKSIMNYDMPSDLNTDGISTHRGNEYSDGDKQWFAMMY